MEDSLDWKGWTDHFSKMPDRRLVLVEFKLIKFLLQREALILI